MIRGCNLLYHEATYPAALEALADEYMHSTSQQAARIAADAQAGQLCIGHYSGRIEDETAHLHEAQEIFPNTLLTREGMVIKVK